MDHFRDLLSCDDLPPEALARIMSSFPTHDPQNPGQPLPEPWSLDAVQASGRGSYIDLGASSMYVSNGAAHASALTASACSNSTAVCLNQADFDGVSAGGGGGCGNGSNHVQEGAGGAVSVHGDEDAAATCTDRGHAHLAALAGGGSGGGEVRISLPPLWHDHMHWRQVHGLRFGALRIRYEYVNAGCPLVVRLSYPSDLMPPPRPVLMRCSVTGDVLGPVEEMYSGAASRTRFTAPVVAPGTERHGRVAAEYRVVLATHCQKQKCKLFRFSFDFHQRTGANGLVALPCVTSEPFFVTPGQSSFGALGDDTLELAVLSEVRPRFARLRGSGSQLEVVPVQFRIQLKLRCGTFPDNPQILFRPCHLQSVDPKLATDISCKPPVFVPSADDEFVSHVEVTVVGVVGRLKFTYIPVL